MLLRAQARRAFDRRAEAHEVLDAASCWAVAGAGSFRWPVEFRREESLPAACRWVAEFRPAPRVSPSCRVEGQCHPPFPRSCRKRPAARRRRTGGPEVSCSWVLPKSCNQPHRTRGRSLRQSVMPCHFPCRCLTLPLGHSAQSPWSHASSSNTRRVSGAAGSWPGASPDPMPPPPHAPNNPAVSTQAIRTRLFTAAPASPRSSHCDSRQKCSTSALVNHWRCRRPPSKWRHSKYCCRRRRHARRARKIHCECRR